ncbi:MAG: glycerol dehydratase reactivase beta/small subunit family protein [Rhodospirillaceae bacterium]
MAEAAPIPERRPAVQVVAFRTDEAVLRPLLWGLEEEQIPAEVGAVEHGGAAALAEEAAHMSALNVGIAFDGAAGTVALHHRDLAGRAPLFVLDAAETTPERLLRLGKNAARLVKGNPLVFDDAPPAPESAPAPEPAAAAPFDEAALIDRLADLVIARMRKP